MASVQINSNIQNRIEEFIKIAPKLEISVLEQFMMDINKVIAKKKAPNLSKKEAALLKAIYNAYSPKTTKRLEELSLRMFEDKITEEELKEYRILANESEERSLIRLQNLFELAQLKNTTVPKLMTQLGLEKK